MIARAPATVRAEGTLRRSASSRALLCVCQHPFGQRGNRPAIQTLDDEVPRVNEGQDDHIERAGREWGQSGLDRLELGLDAWHTTAKDHKGGNRREVMITVHALVRRVPLMAMEGRNGLNNLGLDTSHALDLVVHGRKVGEALEFLNRRCGGLHIIVGRDEPEALIDANMGGKELSKLLHVLREYLLIALVGRDGNDRPLIKGSTRGDLGERSDSRGVMGSKRSGRRSIGRGQLTIQLHIAGSHEDDQGVRLTIIANRKILQRFLDQNHENHDSGDHERHDTELRVTN